MGESQAGPEAEPETAVDYFMRTFGPVFWRQYSHLGKELQAHWGATLDHHFEFVRHKLWYQLILIWKRIADRGMLNEDWDMECAKQVLREGTGGRRPGAAQGRGTQSRGCTGAGLGQAAVLCAVLCGR